MAQKQQPPQIPLAQRLPDGSTTELQDLDDLSCVIDLNYDYNWAFWRTVKVLFASYPESDANSPPSYQNMNLFIHDMQQLYNVPNITQNDIDVIINGLTSENFCLHLTIKKFKGRDRITNPRVLFNYFGHIYDLNLDADNEVQQIGSHQIIIGYTMLGNIRRDPNAALLITLEGTHWQQPNDQLNVFGLGYAWTHPEGYQDWFDFGRGVQLLISVEYRVINEPNVTQTQASEFHLHTIYRMLERRLQEYGARTKWNQLGHRQVAFKSSVTHNKPCVNPLNNEMFWTAPSYRRTHTVKFVDFQRGYLSNEDFEENVCLCSEWCNWNAFFFHNPIYRFLMVRHDQLYLTKRLNLPSMYMALSILAGCTPSPQNTPILHLMSSANDYRQKYYEKYYLIDPNFVDEYKTFFPSAAGMNAVSYNLLKNQLNVTALCHRLDARPSSDISIESLINYFKALTDLHIIQTLVPRFVYDRKLWYLQIDLIGRRQYCDYVRESYKKSIADYVGGYDFLFTQDYEYSSRMATNRNELHIKSIRDQVLKKLLSDSPFNIRITSNNFCYTFAAVYKFLSKVEPMLPVAHKVMTMDLIIECYSDIDDELDVLYNDNLTAFNFEINLIDPRFQNFEQNFHVFYTLKMYFYLFDIQKTCINAMIRKMKRVEYNQCQVCDLFKFIWRNSTIEEKYVNTYPGEFLFEEIPDFFQEFDDFYEQFWPKADHERYQMQNVQEYVDSGHFAYQRLYFWLRNDGNNRWKFAKIIENFDQSITGSADRSEDLFWDWIREPIKALRQSGYRYNLEVFDQLVYYLVKANCSVILSTIQKYFQQILNLQDQQLANDNVCYSLSKPGWVPLLRTLYTVLDTINRVSDYYVDFEDEFEHISNVCAQTKIMVRDMYRQIYMKLNYECINEIIKCLRLNVNPNINAAEFLELQLCAGQAFMGAFVNDFRHAFFRYRRYFQNALRSQPFQVLQNIRFHACRHVFEDYFRDGNAMRTAIPFRSHGWRAHLAQLFARLDQLTENDVSIDLNDANV